MIASAVVPYSAMRNWSCPSDTANEPLGGSIQATVNSEKKYITTAGRHDHRAVVNAIPTRNRSMKRGGGVSKTKIPIAATASEYAAATKYGSWDGFKMAPA